MPIDDGTTNDTTNNNTTTEQKTTEDISIPDEEIITYEYIDEYQSAPEVNESEDMPIVESTQVYSLTR